MATELSADDLLRVAERLEHRGARFYRMAAARCPDPAGRRVLAELARMEGEHEEVFSAIRQHWASVPAGRRRSPRALAEASVVIDLTLGNLEGDLRERFAGRSSAADILREAIEFEKDTIVFLTQLGASLTSAEDRRSIQRILQEELTHVFLLGEELAKHLPRRGASPFLHATA